MGSYVLIIYFLAGVVSDFLFTMNMRFIAKERALLTAIVAVLTTIISMYVLYTIITGLQSNRSLIAILTYALGIGVGAYIAMRLKLGK